MIVIMILKTNLIGKLRNRIDFPSIETTFYIDKEKYLEAESFGFKGYCEPINALIGYSYEDFISFLPIKIKE